MKKRNRVIVLMGTLLLGGVFFFLFRNTEDSGRGRTFSGTGEPVASATADRGGVDSTTPGEKSGSRTAPSTPFSRQTEDAGYFRPGSKAFIDALGLREVPSAMSREESPAGNGRVRIKRRFLARIDFKYPNVIVDEVREREAATGKERVVSWRARVTDHILVRLNEGKTRRDLEALNGKYGTSIRRELHSKDHFLVRFEAEDDTALERRIRQFREESQIVRVAEADHIVFASSLTPDDSRYAELWGMHNTGQTGGTDGIDIDAPEAWGVFTGSTALVAGVIDTGIDYTHPDLVRNIWVNPGETPGNGVDDDGNGFVDDVHGYDFVNDDGDPMDGNDHGTHVSGTMAGDGNNGTGVVGVNWRARIMGLKFLSDSGFGSTSDAVDAVNYVTMMRSSENVPIVLTNNSWGGGGFSQSLKDAIEGNQGAGILFVAAAGNASTDLDEANDYPAGYDNDNIVSVAAIDHDDELAGFSNYGLTRVDLAAPGVETLSTVPGGGYSSFSGTSMASPHVAGVALLAWGLNPNATWDQIKDALMNGTVHSSAAEGRTVSGGRLNAFNTLLELGMNVITSVPDQNEVVNAPPVDFVIHFSDDYDSVTVDPGDLTVNGIPADAVEETDSNTLTFSFSTSPVVNEGEQRMEIAEDALTRTLDDDGVGAWSSLFLYDALPMDVTSTVPAAGSIVPSGIPVLRLQFNEDVLASSIGPGDLILSQGSVVSAAVVNSTTVDYTLSGVNQDGKFVVQIPAGQIEDAHGNPNPTIERFYFIDYVSESFPVDPLNSVPHEGSLVYDGVARGFLTAGDEDEFLLTLEENQFLTALLTTPDDTLTPAVTLRFAGGTQATATASAGGGNAVIQAHPLVAPGLYRVAVSGAGEGGYELRLVLNAIHESEGNDSGAAANDLAPVEFSQSESGLVDEGIRRLSAVGSVGGGGDTEDWFRFPVGAGDVVSLTLARLSGETVPRLELFTPAGDLLAVGSREGNHPQLIADAMFAAGGDYLARVTGESEAGYHLNVIRNASFDIEDNSSESNAQPLRVTNAAAGYIGAGTNTLVNEIEPNDDGVPGGTIEDLAFANDVSTSFASIGGNDYEMTVRGEIDEGNDGDWDFFQFFAGPGDTISVTMIGDSLGDAYLRLYDESGTEIAYNDDGGIGLGSLLEYDTFATVGAYYIVGDSFGSHTGTYEITATLTTSTLRTSSPVDVFAFEATSGDTVTAEVEVPFSVPGEQPVNALDPVLSLLDPDGAVVVRSTSGTVSNQAINRNGTHLWMVEAENDTVGEFSLEFAGAPQSAPRELLIESVSVPDQALVNRFPDRVVVVFTNGIDVTTLQGSDLTVNGVAATGFTVLDGRTVAFDIDPAANTGDGDYTIALAAGGVSNLQGNPTPGDFSSGFAVDATPPAVTGTSVSEGGILAPGDVTIDIDFSEPMNEENISFFAFALWDSSGNFVYEESFTMTAERFSVTYAGLGEENYTLTLFGGPYGFEDLAGNALDPDPFERNFVVDTGTGVFPGWQAREPNGSWVYHSGISGRIGTEGDEDSWTLELTGNGRLVALVEPQGEGDLVPTLRIVDPQGNVAGPVAAGGPGEGIAVSSPTGLPGTYTVIVSGSGTGAYALSALANAAVEQEAFGGADNGTPGNAESVDGSRIEWSPGVSRMALRGRSTIGGGGENEVDYLSFAGEADDFMNLVLSSPVEPVAFELVDPGGRIVTVGTGSNPRFISDVRLRSSGTYRVRLEFDRPGDYALLILQNAAFEMEPNNDAGEGGRLLGVDHLFGATGGGDSIAESEPNDDGIPGGSAGDLPFADDARKAFAPAGPPDEYLATMTGEIAAGDDGDWDFFRFSAGPGDSVVMDLIGDTLEDTYLRLYDRDGVSLDVDDDGGDGLFARISYSSFAYDGDYFAVADSFGGNTGTYTLTIRQTSATPRGDRGDRFRISGVASQSLRVTSATPGDSGFPFGVANTHDPSLRLFDPAGGEVVFDANGAPDGRNARVTHVPASDGIHEVQIESETGTDGEYILVVEGHDPLPMPPQSIDAEELAEGERTSLFPQELTITFSTNVDLSTVDASDLTVNGVSSTGFTVVDAGTIRFSIDPGGATGDGSYRVRIADGDILTLQGASSGALDFSFELDTAGPGVVATSVPEGAVIPTGDLILTIDFSEEIRVENIDAGDFSLTDSQGSVIGATAFSLVGSRLTLEYGSLEGTFQLTLTSGDGAFEDLAGNDLEPGDYVLNFSRDVVVEEFPSLVPVFPLGGMIYTGKVDAELTAGDTDTWTIGVDPGQTVSFIVSTGVPDLEPELRIVDPGGNELGPFSPEAGDEGRIVFRPRFVSEGGVFTLEVSGGGSGVFSLEVILNGASEDEAGEGENETRATAEDLEVTRIPVGFSGERLALLGRSDTAGGGAATDVFRFSGGAGQAVNVVAGGGTAPVSLELLGPDGTVLATGGADGEVSSITGAVLGESGDHFVRLGFDTDTVYSLLVFRNSYFDVEPNHLDASRDFGGDLGVGTVLGHLEAGDTVEEIEPNDSPEDAVSIQAGFTHDVSNKYVNVIAGRNESGADPDYFRFRAQPGDSVTVRLQGTAGTDPFFRIFDREGTELDSDDDFLFFGSFSYSGDYYVSTEATGANDYTLTVTLTADDPPVDSEDAYRIELEAGDSVAFYTGTPGDGEREFGNNLDPVLSLFDEAGDLVASASGGGEDARNAILVFSPETSGNYRLSIRGENQTGGVYTISTDFEAVGSYLSWIEGAVPVPDTLPETIAALHDPGADPEDDGVENGTEYGFGLVPMLGDADSDRLPRFVREGNRAGVRFTIPVPARPGADYIVECTEDLETWSLLKERIAGSAWEGPGEIFGRISLGGAETLTILEPEPGGGSEKFFRVRVSVPFDPPQE